jgi:hypothetical protein
MEARPAFEGLLKQFPGARTLAADLAELAKREDTSLEEKLRQYHLHQDARVRRHYADVPRYLGALLHQVSHSFTEMPGTYIRLIHGLFADIPHRVTFIVLNYDTLLETAIARFDHRCSFDTMERYVDEAREWSMFKVHGSIDWFIEGKANTEFSANGPVTTYTLPKRPWSIMVNPGLSHSSPEVFPAIVPPLSGKVLDDLLCPAGHMTALRRELGQCTKFLAIGTSGLDAHVTELLRCCLPEAQAIHVVAGSDSHKVAQRFREGVPSLNRPIAENFDRGFKEYVNGDGFKRLLRI